MVLLEFNGGNALSVRNRRWNGGGGIPKQERCFSASEQRAFVKVEDSGEAVRSTSRQARIAALRVRKRTVRDEPFDASENECSLSRYLARPKGAENYKENVAVEAGSNPFESFESRILDGSHWSYLKAHLL